ACARNRRQFEPTRIGDCGLNTDLLPHSVVHSRELLDRCGNPIAGLVSRALSIRTDTSLKHRENCSLALFPKKSSLFAPRWRAIAMSPSLALFGKIARARGTTTVSTALGMATPSVCFTAPVAPSLLFPELRGDSHPTGNIPVSTSDTFGKVPVLET